jgi:hypothetical protein
VPGDVSDQEANPVLINRKEIVEIAGDSGHRMIGGGHTDMVQFGNAVRKNRGLYLAGDGKFLFNGKKSALVRADPLQGDISKGEQKNCKTEVVQNARSLETEGLRQFVIQSLNGENECADGQNATAGQSQVLVG